MTTTYSIDGVSSASVVISNMMLFDPANWRVVDTEVLSYEKTGFTPVMGSRTIYRNTENTERATTVRIEVNPGRDTDGTPKYNVSIRWNGFSIKDVDGVETVTPATAVLAWTSLASPVFHGDAVTTGRLLRNLFSFTVPETISGALDPSSVADIALGLTAIDLANLTRT